MSPGFHTELAVRLTHAFDLITGGGHHVKFMRRSVPAPLIARPTIDEMPSEY